MTTRESPTLGLDDLVPQFYGEVGPKHHTYERGQICWTHINYAEEQLLLWRSTGTDESKTTVHTFRIENSPKDAFSRSFPLYIPPLETHEEFVVVKAKRRPVIILSPCPPDPGVRGLRQGGKIHRHICLVAPIFTVIERTTNQPKYPAEFIERMRTLAYPEFFYLPSQGAIRRASYVRLGEMQAVFQPQLEPENQKLLPDILGILQGQLDYLLTGKYGGDYGFVPRAARSAMTAWKTGTNNALCPVYGSQLPGHGWR